MSYFSKLTGRRRVRAAVKQLGNDPSAENYLALAREFVVTGELDEVLRVCQEGLEVHPGSPELTRIRDRARHMHIDARLRDLQLELQLSPRPALWREMCQLLLDSDRSAHAEELAAAWHGSTEDAEAIYYRARARAAMFFDERRSEDGREAFHLGIAASRSMANDARPLELCYQLALRIGAWHEARTAVARLLELKPGDPDLELRFRKVLANCHEAMTLDRALLEVERTGRFVDDRPEGSRAPASVTVRPALQRLGAEPEVEAAVFLRGGTALVQGPTGATADRTARSVREVAQKSRDAARRLALGRVIDVQMEGDFGCFRLVPGDQGIAAIWARGSIKKSWVDTLTSLAGTGGAA